MKRLLFFSVLLLGCGREMLDDLGIMARPPRSIPRMIDGLSDGRAVVYFSDGYTHQVKLVDPETGQSKDLNIGSDKNLVMALRVGWGDTIFVITLEEHHLKLHKFTPQGVPRGKHVLKNALPPSDFLVVKSGDPTGGEIVTLNFDGPMCALYDETGKRIASGGPITGPGGPFIDAWMAVVQSTGVLLVIPRHLKGECADCNYISGPIRVHLWGEGTTGEYFPLIMEIDLSPLFEGWDKVSAEAAKGYGTGAYVLVHLYDFDEQTERIRTGYALVAVDPTTDPRKYEMIQTTEYKDLYWGEDGKLYTADGKYVPAVTCVAISREGKLFLAYGDGHVEVCEITD